MGDFSMPFYFSFNRLNMIKAIEYTPTENDALHIKQIKDFFNENNITFDEVEDNFGIFHVKDFRNEKVIEIRYVNSFYHKMDNSKRFGEQCSGIDKDYFINVSHDNIDNDIRTIWIFDFEMEQKSDVPQYDGTILRDYHRQWEVIKNTILTATGHIKYQFNARDCEIREVSNAELRPFLNTYCFYGYRAANTNLGLYLKKDKFGYKAGTLLMVYTFSPSFYGNHNKDEKDMFVEIIRVSTMIGCQVRGGASKCVKHFLLNYPTLIVGNDKREMEVRKLLFYVDASHNDGRAMTAMNFDFVSWEGTGFMNIWTQDFDEIYEREDGRKVHLMAKKGEVQHRKPLAHKRIMELIRDGIIYSVGNAGTQVYTLDKEKYLNSK